MFKNLQVKMNFDDKIGLIQAYEAGFREYPCSLG